MAITEEKYLPPEVINGEEYTMPADVWGLGVILFQMATLNLPFESPVKDRTMEAEDIR
jgi:serine/threonine protein kinase